MELTNDHFRLLVESISDYAIFLLDPSGDVVSWSAGARRIKGYEASEIIGQPVSTFYTAADRTERVWQLLLEKATKDGSAEDIGWRVRKDGTQFWASVVVTALRAPDGELIGFAKVVRDRTDDAYRTFVEATNAIVWTTDAHGQPSGDSPGWRAFTGQTVEDWMGRRAYDPVHPEDQPRIRVEWPRAREEKVPFHAEFRLRRHDGAYLWMAARAIPLLREDGSVRAWFGVTFDISKRKKAELERERAIAWWSTTLRSIGDGVIATDAQGAVTFMNAVAEELTGWTSAEAEGKPLDEVFRIVNEETRTTVESPVAKVLREGVVVGLANHTVLLRRDGSERAIDDSAAPIRYEDGTLDGVVLVFRDVSDEKLDAARREFLARAGEELMQADDYHAALVRVAQLAVPRLADWCAIDFVEEPGSAPERLTVAHVDPEKVAYAHALAERYPPDSNATRGVPEVIRTGRSELYHEIPPELLEASAVDEEHRRIVRELDLRSAMVVPLHARTRIIGAISFVYTGHRRYTEDDLALAEELARRAALVVERRRLEQEATSATKAKDEFLAMLGHELRNPLAPIRTALELMRLRGDTSTLREQQVIERQVDHLVRLVDDLLDVSRITRGRVRLDREPIEVSTVIAHAIEMVSPLLEQRRHRVEIDVPRDGLVVEADPARLAQVFSNLVANAAKYSDPEGEIHVSASAEDGEVVVLVRDRGIGILPEVLPSIFDSFVQAGQTIERSQGGLGLGLSIVRSLVHLHGGTVSAASEGRGCGATFTVRLPLHTDRPTPSMPRRATKSAPPPRSRRRVLVVDDNDDAAGMLEQVLGSFGYETRVASDGPSALAALASFEPELAVLDIGLPVMDGYELAERIRASMARPPLLVALTGYGNDHDRARAATAGFHRHLVKPVELEVLRRTIDDLFREPPDEQAR